MSSNSSSQFDGDSAGDSGLLDDIEDTVIVVDNVEMPRNDGSKIFCKQESL